MRALTLNEVEMVNGAESQPLVDSYFSSIGFWGIFGATIGGSVYQAMNFFEPVSPLANLLLTLSGQSAELSFFAGIGLGFTIGAAFGLGFYTVISAIEEY